MREATLDVVRPCTAAERAGLFLSSDKEVMFENQDIDRYNQIWQSFIEPKLGKKPLQQFVRATKSPSHWFANNIVRPSLFRLSSSGGGIYYPVDVTAFSLGRNEIVAKIIATEPDPIGSFGGDPWQALTFFANPLRTISTKQIAGDGSEDDLIEADAPKNRVVLGEHQVLTYEFDVPDVEFLKVQLGWLRARKNELDCRMGELFRRCSRFADFSGITVNHSGNKSLHIHVVFSTSLARSRLNLDRYRADELRGGIVAHWEVLHDTVIRALGVEGLNADRSLRFPEAFRRVPNGSREVGAGHILGIPEGTIVPQITLWEKSRARAGGDELSMFWTPEPFAAPVRLRVGPRGAGAGRTSLGDMTQDEKAYCEAQLAAYYEERWPRFDHLAFDAQRWVAKFRNSEADQTPSSVMREDYRSIHVVGRDANGLEGRRLPFDLGEMLRLWKGQYARQRGRVNEVVTLNDLVTPASSSRELTTLEEAFRSSARDPATARVAMKGFFRAALASEATMLIKGPEGVGKTSTLMSLHDEVVSRLDPHRSDKISMYAFSDYAAAEEKCAAFNSLQAANGFAGVVVPSFGRIYEKECERLKVSTITTEQAAVMGFDSRWAAIRRWQPAIVAALQARHQQFWCQIGSQKPVFFTVHQVAHEWKSNSLTRLYWSPSFWADSLGSKGTIKKLRKETSLCLLIHDEVKWDSFVEALREDDVRWVEDMLQSDWEIWGARRQTLVDQYESFERFRTKRGDRGITFEAARRIAQVPGGITAWGHVVTADTREYPVKVVAAENDNGATDIRADMYGERHGRDWRVIPKKWWVNAADRVILLTTEALPTAIARAADPDGLRTFELETPCARRDSVDVYANRSVRGDSLVSLCQEFRDQRPGEEWSIISNKVSCLTDTLPPIMARGSNEMIGKNVMQTMCWMTPGEYEQIQVLNAWTRRSDLVGIRHVDEFNQSAGRNLGFRRRDDVRHALLINRRLLDVLLNHPKGVLGLARYDLRLRLDKDDRYEAQHRERSRAA